MSFLTFFLNTTYLLFCIGLFGIFLMRKNIIVTLMSIEIMLLSINLNFLINSCILDDSLGLVSSIIVLSLAAAESSLGLALLIVYFRLRGVVSINIIKSLKG
jgi:NADH:ubiquinone oxidoreductase subunit K